jgi:Fic-DOC domain mobile mystery protein B
MSIKETKMSTILNAPGDLGDTPLHPDDLAQLIPNLHSKRDLDEWERQNILDAQKWAYNPQVLARRNPLDEIYLRGLHRRMFDSTWKWAGKYRTKDLNIGCRFCEIHQRIAVLLGNTQFWIDNKTFDVDEIAVRFHHRLVSEIHAFPNGNGRHGRLLASAVVVKHGRGRFTWGRGVEHARDQYLSGLRAMDDDNEDVQGLLKFARS